MADEGSRRWFQYKDDEGTGYAVELDETHGETAALGFGVVQPDDLSRVIRKGVPIQMRYINCSRVDADGATERRKFPVGAIGADAFKRTTSTISVDGKTWNVTSKRGEKAIRIPIQDTGETDGDVDTNVAAGP